MQWATGMGMGLKMFWGAHNQKAKFLFEKEGPLRRLEFPEMAKDSASEDVSATLFNGNLIVGSGGNVVSFQKSS